MKCGLYITFMRNLLVSMEMANKGLALHFAVFHEIALRFPNEILYFSISAKIRVFTHFIAFRLSDDILPIPD